MLELGQRSIFVARNLKATEALLQLKLCTIYKCQLTKAACFARL